jgi:hypothetical protein
MARTAATPFFVAVALWIGTHDTTGRPRRIRVNRRGASARRGARCRPGQWWGGRATRVSGGLSRGHRCHAMDMDDQLLKVANRGSYVAVAAPVWLYSSPRPMAAMTSAPAPRLRRPM